MTYFQWARIIMIMERTYTKKQLLRYRDEYSNDIKVIQDYYFTACDDHDDDSRYIVVRRVNPKSSSQWKRKEPLLRKVCGHICSCQWKFVWSVVSCARMCVHV
jgi:hypothetical protein